MSISENYLERVYAGVLGKLIGVYLGRPFEGWTYQRIMKELGTIEYYVHERLGMPLVVTDDDVSGTFTFIRALTEHGVKPDLSAEEIGKTWLNAIVERQSILWWGGNGISTEHTAWLNLKRGMAAPRSGSIEVNGATVAEQIGAQIFIDGWAMVAPGQPLLAARLAHAAATVSHDGEAVFAAQLLAAMEAQAFLSDDVEHLIDVGLSVIPSDSLIARVIADVRTWHRALPDWRDARQQVEDHYGYDKFPGNCHVVPNHALIILALLYCNGDFHQAMLIINTAGWDTDCNAGNLGCLIGIMRGLKGFEGGPDWRGPLADRAIVSASDGGYAINDAVRIAYDIANLGYQLSGLPPLPPPKQGAQFHFSLPASVQGFMADRSHYHGTAFTLAQGHMTNGTPALGLHYKGAERATVAAAMTATFSPPNVDDMLVYGLPACPRVCSGQTLQAHLLAAGTSTGLIGVALRVMVYGKDDQLFAVDTPSSYLSPGAQCHLNWTLPDFDGQAIAQIGIVVTPHSDDASGTVWLDYLRWDGAPQLRLKRPTDKGTFWHKAWVNNVSLFAKNAPVAFRISQDQDTGIIIYGTREWTDYCVASTLTLHLGRSGGLAARVQGLRRYYALLLEAPGHVRLVKVRDDMRTVMAEVPFSWRLDQPVALALELRDNEIIARVDGAELLRVHDEDPTALTNGGIGLVITEGALTTDLITVSANTPHNNPSTSAQTAVASV